MGSQRECLTYNDNILDIPVFRSLSELLGGIRAAAAESPSPKALLILDHDGVVVPQKVMPKPNEEDPQYEKSLQHVNMWSGPLHLLKSKVIDIAPYVKQYNQFQEWFINWVYKDQAELANIADETVKELAGEALTIYDFLMHDLQYRIQVHPITSNPEKHTKAVIWLIMTYLLWEKWFVEASLLDKPVLRIQHDDGLNKFITLLEDSGQRYAADLSQHIFQSETNVPETSAPKPMNLFARVPKITFEELKNVWTLLRQTWQARNTGIVILSFGEPTIIVGFWNFMLGIKNSDDSASTNERFKILGPTSIETLTTIRSLLQKIHEGTPLTPKEAKILARRPVEDSKAVILSDHADTIGLIYKDSTDPHITVGGFGDSKSDLHWLRKLWQICRNRRLPVIVDRVPPPTL